MTKPRRGSLDLGEALALLQRQTFGYFVHEANPSNGLIRDNTRYGSSSSIAAVGLGLACYPVAVRRGYLTREEAAGRSGRRSRFFAGSPQGPEPDATGYRGFYYHFLDLRTGRRAHGCELSTMDTAILLAGALTAAEYFDGNSAEEVEIRRLANSLYRAADWAWALAGGRVVRQGWTPEGGFLPFGWQGYNEALLLYVLALGSPISRYRPKATTRGRRRTSGKRSMASNSCTADRSSCTRSRTSGSTSAESTTPT